MKQGEDDSGPVDGRRGFDVLVAMVLYHCRCCTDTASLLRDAKDAGSASELGTMDIGFEEAVVRWRTFGDFLLYMTVCLLMTVHT